MNTGGVFDCSLYTGVVTEEPEAIQEIDLYCLPVVVHVIYDENPETNIAGPEKLEPEQVEELINNLNEIYRDLTPNASSIDTKIEFTLAKVGPNNECTDGINYRQSPLTVTTSPGVETQNDPVTSLIMWDPTRYLNIWIVRDIDLGQPGGADGYSSFPFFQTAGREGFVVEYDLASEGIAHEAGHFMGLLHPWGCNSGCDGNCGDSNEMNEKLNDFVDDTNPAVAAFIPENIDCSAMNVTNVCFDICFAEGIESLAYPFDNYMTTAVMCSYRFTPNQIKRMFYHLNTTYLRGLWYPGYIIKDEKIVEEPIKFHKDVNIYAGGRLVLRSEVVMAEGAEIIVHQGGQLVVDGGHIRGCDISDTERGLWGGIRVLGRNQDGFDVELLGSLIEDVDGYAVNMASSSLDYFLPENGSLHAEGTIFSNVAGLAIIASAVPSINGSIINGCTQNGGSWGIANWNGLNVSVTNNDFFDIDLTSVSTTGGAYEIIGNEFHSGSEDVALTHVVAGLRSIIYNNDFYGTKIGIHASGSTIDPHIINDNTFHATNERTKANRNIYMDGSAHYDIFNNEFQGTLGVVSRSNGDFVNIVRQNDFFVNNIGLNIQNDNSGYNFYENCFSSIAQDVHINGQISEQIQSGNGVPANNCFSHFGNLNSTVGDIAGKHIPFEYFEPDNGSSLDCRDAFKAGGNVIRVFDGNDIETNCDNREGSEFFEEEMELNLQTALLNNDFEFAESLVNDSNLFEDKQLLFSIKLMQGEFTKGKALLEDLQGLSEEQMDWKQISLMYANILENPERQNIDIEEINSISLQIALKSHSYSGYAQALYFLNTTAFVDNLDLSFFDNLVVEERSLTDGLVRNNKSIYFYPNPASNIIYIQNQEEFKSLVLYNTLGETVYTYNGESSINVEEFRNGIYWAKIEYSNGVEMLEKLVITK